MDAELVAVAAWGRENMMVRICAKFGSIFLVIPGIFAVGCCRHAEVTHSMEVAPPRLRFTVLEGMDLAGDSPAGVRLTGLPPSQDNTALVETVGKTLDLREFTTGTSILCERTISFSEGEFSDRSATVLLVPSAPLPASRYLLVLREVPAGARVDEEPRPDGTIGVAFTVGGARTPLGVEVCPKTDAWIVRIHFSAAGPTKEFIGGARLRDRDGQVVECEVSGQKRLEVGARNDVFEISAPGSGVCRAYARRLARRVPSA